VVASLIAYRGGHWIDRSGPKRVFATGAGVYIAAYALFALVSGGWPLLVLAFVLAGAGIGLAETAESALVAAAALAALTRLRDGHCDRQRSEQAGDRRQVQRRADSQPNDQTSRQQRPQDRAHVVARTLKAIGTPVRLAWRECRERRVTHRRPSTARSP
jgi:hypothetical protein